MTVRRYVRVGTLDEPGRFPPQAHIFVRSKQPRLVLNAAAPAFKAYYDAAKLWPAASPQRHAEAKRHRETVTVESRHRHQARF